MCGRDTLLANWSQVWEFCQPLPMLTPDQSIQSTWNRAPTQDGWVMRWDEQQLKPSSMRWGLIPSWAKDAKTSFSTINARQESVDSKPAFREAFKQRRCVVPSSGYFEWRARGKSKQPFYIQPLDAEIFCFAGLWEQWISSQGESVLSYSIITRPATPQLLEVHDRMPVLLNQSEMLTWLNGNAQQASDLLQNHQPARLRWHAVGPAVGNVRNNLAKVIEPVAEIIDLLG